jgi:hypothetical protein
LYNPRTDRWADHFALAELGIRPLTDIGRVTVGILDLNGVDRLLEREAYPTADALLRIR